MQQLHIVLLAGVQTKSSFFTPLVDRLEKILIQKGIVFTIQIAYPYGDYRRSLWLQVLDLYFDINVRFTYHGIGGYRLKTQLEQTIRGESGHYLFIGHSGGGIAAYRFARYMHYRKGTPLERLKIIQIGAPKTKIIAPFHTITSYIQAIDKHGKLKDPITKLGYWGGFKLPSRNQAWWDASKHAPHQVSNIPLIGGHADYFRVYAPFIHKTEQSNLDFTFSAIAAVLDEWAN